MPLDVRAVALPPGASRAYDASEWAGAIVLVARGSVELRFAGGASERFPRGAIIWLARLSLDELRNPDSCEALLLAVSRA